MRFDPLLRKQSTSLREDGGYSNSEPVNLHSLLFKLNVITFFKPLSEDFSGMAFRFDDSDFILVNSNQAVGRQNFTIAHELYHLKFQKDFTTHKCQISNLEGDRATERKANQFAALFLLPEEALFSNIPEHELKKDKISLATLLKLEQIFEVSHTYLLYRLQGLKLLSEEGWKKHAAYSIKQQVSSYGLPTDLYEPGNHNKIIGDYGLLAKGLLEDHKISEGHYFELMKVLKG